MNAITTTTTSRDECIKDDIALRNQLTMTAMKRVEAMLRSYAYTHELDVEDLYQDVCEEMIRVCDRMPEKASVPYLFGVARLYMRLIVRQLETQEVATTSLDAPVFEKLTLADMLPAPNITPMTEQEEARIEKVTEVVHAALATCRLEEQEYACKAFELIAYTPVPPVNLPVVIRNRHCAEQRRSNNMRQSIKRTFHRNPQVLSLLQHETCIL